MAQEIYVTVKDYSEFVGRSIPTIHNWIKTGKIPAENVKIVLHTILIKKIYIS